MQRNGAIQGEKFLDVIRKIEGMTRTEATPGVIVRRASAAGVSEVEMERQMTEGNSVRRIINASDIANVVTFLASPLAWP